MEYPLTYVLVQVNRTKALTLDGLDARVRLATPLTGTFTITTVNGRKPTVSRQQLPITPAYAFANYRFQGQTIEHCVVDIGAPPIGRLTLFSRYVALPRSYFSKKFGRAYLNT